MQQFSSVLHSELFRVFTAISRLKLKRLLRNVHCNSSATMRMRIRFVAPTLTRRSSVVRPTKNLSRLSLSCSLMIVSASYTPCSHIRQRAPSHQTLGRIENNCGHVVGFGGDYIIQSCPGWDGTCPRLSYTIRHLLDLALTGHSLSAVDMQDDPLLKVPDFLKAHPELRRRGIILTEPLKPVSV